jgi:predicted protein tyrosine phosphatase
VVFAQYQGVEALSAGTNPDAETPLSADLIEWADLIVAMEGAHRRRMQRRFARLVQTKQVAVLGIPDRYAYMSPELVGILKEKVAFHLERNASKRNSVPLLSDECNR